MKNKYTGISHASLGVNLLRQNAGPLDGSTKFYSKEDAYAYITRNTSYNNPKLTPEDNKFLQKIIPYSYVNQEIGIEEEGYVSNWVILKVGPLQAGEEITDRYLDLKNMGGGSIFVESVTEDGILKLGGSATITDDGNGVVTIG